MNPRPQIGDIWHCGEDYRVTRIYVHQGRNSLEVVDLDCISNKNMSPLVAYDLDVMVGQTSYWSRLSTIGDEMKRRIRNYRAMTDEKLYRCYWELRNGYRNGTHKYNTDGVEWDSSFGTEAYEVCINKGSANPFGDIKVIESEAEKRDIKLWNHGFDDKLKRRARAGINLEHEVEEIEEDDQMVIEI